MRNLSSKAKSAIPISVLRAVIRASAMLVALALISAPTLAAEKPIEVENGEARAERVRVFSGVLDLSDLRAAAEDSAPKPLDGVMKPESVIMNQGDLEILFREWKLGDPPKIDFTRQILTVATWGGSRITMFRGVDRKGNLSVIAGGGTSDVARTAAGDPGMTYLIEVYTLTNIKAVNGQKWPAAGQVVD